MKDEVKEKLNEQLEEKICSILEEGIEPNNIEMLDILVDIHKDVANEEYWKGKENSMRYENYSNYGRGYRNEYGRGYSEGSYVRRGSDRRYRGHNYMDRMSDEYSRYEEGRQDYNAGNYGAKDDTLKSLEYMLESMVDFVAMLKSEANSQEEMELIRKYTQHIAQM